MPQKYEMKSVKGRELLVYVTSFQKTQSLFWRVRNFPVLVLPQPLKILFFILCPTCTAIRFCNFIQTNKLWSWGSEFSMILTWFTLQWRSGITIRLNVKGLVQIFWFFEQSITFALFLFESIVHVKTIKCDQTVCHKDPFHIFMFFSSIS